MISTFTLRSIVLYLQGVMVFLTSSEPIEIMKILKMFSIYVKDAGLKRQVCPYLALSLPLHKNDTKGKLRLELKLIEFDVELDFQRYLF